MPRLLGALLCAVLLLGLPGVTLAQDKPESYVSAIEIEGNQRTERSTILTYLTIREGQKASKQAIDTSLKNIFSTGLFADVNITLTGNTLKVSVVENPIIDKVAFEGNKRIESDKLTGEISLKSRSVFTKAAVQSDLKRILDIYRRSGRFSTEVTPKVIQLDQNRVNLVFEINEGPVTAIKKISFIGNEAFPTSKLARVVRTRTTAWYRFLSSDDTYEPDRLQFDQELLRRFYTNSGYADFQVKSVLAELTPEKDGFYITFTLDEGKLYNFGDVKIESKIPDVSTDDLMSKINTRQGQLYNAEEIDNSVDNLVKALGDLGYAFVRVEPVSDKHPENNLVHLNYQISEGPRVYVERINIHGNVRTLDEVIRREFRLAEGDPYNTSKLQRTEQRLKDLNYFSSVKVSNRQGSAPDKAVIDVEVAEQSTGELTLGAGFSTVDGPLGDIGIRENNFLGKGQQLKLNTTIAAKREQVDFSFTEPYFLDRDLSAGVDIFAIRQDLLSESSYDQETKGVKLRGGYSLSEHLRHTLYYVVREDKISNVQPLASRYIREQEGQDITSAVGHELTYDKRNSKNDPTNGYYVKFTQEIAGLGGDAHYIRDELRGGYFYPVYPQWVLKLLMKGGHITGLGEDVNINDRFFIGSREIRGFRNAGIGPRDVLTSDALGGNLYYAGTAEVMFPLGLPEELGFQGALFVDAGSLWQTDSNGPNIADESAVRISTGAGLAWASPFGPIRIDLGFPVVKKSYDERELLRFSFGTRF